MRCFSLRLFGAGLLGTCFILLLLNHFGNRQPTPLNPPQPPPRRLPTALIPSDAQSLTLFRQQLSAAERSYHSYKRALQTAEQISSPRLASLLDETKSYSGEWYYIVDSWGHSDPQLALAHLATWPNGDSPKAKAMTEVLEIWSNRDGEAAEAWLDNFVATANPDQDTHGLFRFLKSALLDGLAKSDPDRALEKLHEQGVNNSSIKLVFPTSDAWARALERNHKSDFLISNWLLSDQPACEEWLKAQTGERRAASLGSYLGNNLIRYADDPSAKMETYWATLTGSEKARAGSQMIDGLASRDSNLAAEWLNSHEDEPELDSARAKFIGELTSEDPESAHAWVRSIHDQQTREQAELGVFKQWHQLDPASAKTFFLEQGWDEERIEQLRK